MGQQTGAILQQELGDWQFSAILNPHFGNLAYKLVTTSDLTAPPSKEYTQDQELWEDLRFGSLREYGRVALNAFRLFDYVPRAPGLYHDSRARRARDEAFHYLDHRLGPSPAEIDAAAARDYRVVLAPQGKQSMLDGGIGCVRLKPIIAGGDVLMLMSATSSNQAHRGIPIALTEDHYQQVIGPILSEGALICDLEGRMASAPPEIADLFGDSMGIPRLYLRVDDLRIREDLPPPAKPRVSVAVSFTSDYERRNGIYATYVTFTPGENPTFQRAINWLDEVYVQGGYEGKIITDFDQSRSWFPDAALSLRPS